MSRQKPDRHAREKPPSRNWHASDPFFDLKLSHLIGILLTFALVFVGVFQLFIYWGQSSIMSTQAEISRAANGQMAAIQKAFVFVRSMSVERASGSNTAWSVTPEIANSGATPAKNLEIFYVDGNTNWEVSHFAESEGLSGESQARFPDDPAQLLDKLREQATEAGYRGDDARSILDRTIYHWVLGPQSEVPRELFTVSNFGIELSTQIGLERMIKSKFYYGIITYKDLLNENVFHRTMFCFSSGLFVGNSNDRSTYKPIFTPCPHWNCSDEECDADRKNSEKDAANAGIEERTRQEMVRRIPSRIPSPQPQRRPHTCPGPWIECSAKQP